jgi:hypothetical protein
LFILQKKLLYVGGRGGIRTHGTLAGTPVFKTGALNHSATLPSAITLASKASMICTARSSVVNGEPQILRASPLIHALVGG